jgi:hypothetical protein
MSLGVDSSTTEPSCNSSTPGRMGWASLRRFLNCGGMVGYVEDILYYIARHFIQTGRGHEAFKDQRFWTDMFLAQVPDYAR